MYWSLVFVASHLGLIENEMHVYTFDTCKDHFVHEYRYLPDRPDLLLVTVGSNRFDFVIYDQLKLLEINFRHFQFFLASVFVFEYCSSTATK